VARLLGKIMENVLVALRVIKKGEMAVVANIERERRNSIDAMNTRRRSSVSQEPKELLSQDRQASPANQTPVIEMDEGDLEQFEDPDEESDTEHDSSHVNMITPSGEGFGGGSTIAFNTSAFGGAALDAASDASDSKPKLSLKELAQQASNAWATPIIEPPRTPVSRGDRSLHSLGLRSPSARAQTATGSGRPRKKGIHTPISGSSSHRFADPAAAWNWGREGIADGLHVVDIAQADSDTHSLRLTARSISSAGGRSRSAGGRGHIRGEDASPGNSWASSPTSSRPHSAKRPGSARPRSAHQRRRDVVSGLPDWATS